MSDELVEEGENVTLPLFLMILLLFFSHWVSGSALLSSTFRVPFTGLSLGTCPFRYPENAAWPPRELGSLLGSVTDLPAQHGCLRKLFRFSKMSLFRKLKLVLKTSVLFSRFQYVCT